MITMFKKLSIAATAVLMAAACVACGGNDSSSTVDTSKETTTVTTEATTEATTESTTEATTEDATEENTTAGDEDATTDTSTTEAAGTTEAAPEGAEGALTQEQLDKIFEAASEAAKSAKDAGGSEDDIAKASAKAAASLAIEYGAKNPDEIAPLAGKAAGMNGGNGQAAGSACAEMVVKGSVE